MPLAAAAARPGPRRQPGRRRHAVRLAAAASASPRGDPVRVSQPGGHPAGAPARPSGAASPAASRRAGPAARRAASVPATRQCSDPARIGYAIELAFPVINLNSSSAGQCDVPASGAAPGVVVFGWAVRALAATLLALYALGLTGVTRSPPGGA